MLNMDYIHVLVTEVGLNQVNNVKLIVFLDVVHDYDFILLLESSQYAYLTKLSFVDVDIIYKFIYIK